MSRVHLKVGNRYGSTELTSINNGKITLLCDCGNIFEQAVITADRNGVSRCCRDCSNDIASKAITPDKQSVARREYTSQEEQMINDFKKGKKK